MKRIALTISVVAVALAGAAECSAELLTSTKMTVRRGPSTLPLTTSMYQAGTLTRVRDFMQYAHPVVAGADRFSLTVDTTADRATVGDLHLITPTTQPGVHVDDFSVNFDVVDVPANFPNLPVIRHVMGQYSERLTVTGLTMSAPAFVSSSSAPITLSNVGGPHFNADVPVTLTLPELTVTGTYEAIGPQTSKSKPFSLTYHPSVGTNFARFAIPGVPAGQSLSNGFPFEPYELTVLYYPNNSKIFDDAVDDVRYIAEVAEPIALNFFVPEPCGVSLAALAVGGLVAMRRRRIGGPPVV